MRFEVPQFIDIKDKIFGPFTFAQFLFMGGGVGLAYVVTRIIPSFIKYPIALVVAAFGLALAFYKVNGRSFPIVLQAFISYVFSNKLYLWKQRQVKPLPQKSEEPQEQTTDPADDDILSEQELRDLAWSLDIIDAQKSSGRIQTQKPVQ